MAWGMTFKEAIDFLNTPYDLKEMEIEDKEEYLEKIYIAKKIVSREAPSKIISLRKAVDNITDLLDADAYGDYQLGFKGGLARAYQEIIEELGDVV